MLDDFVYRMSIHQCGNIAWWMDGSVTTFKFQDGTYPTNGWMDLHGCEKWDVIEYDSSYKRWPSN